MAYVYDFQSGGENLYKIGRTLGDSEKCRKDFSTSNPHPLNTFRVIETDHDSLVGNFLRRKSIVLRFSCVCARWSHLLDEASRNFSGAVSLKPNSVPSVPL